MTLRARLPDEPEQVLVLDQVLGVADEAIHPDGVHSVLRSHEVDLGKTVVREPPTDARGEVRLLPMSGPDDHRVGFAELWSGSDGPVDVIFGDVPEDAAEEDEIGWYGVRIGVARARVRAPDLYPGESQPTDVT